MQSTRVTACSVVPLIKVSVRVYVFTHTLTSITPSSCAGRWFIYHDALSSWWSAGAQSYMESKGFLNRQVRGLGFTNEGTRYEGQLPGDTPEYMPLDSNLFSDLETAVRWIVAATRMLDNEDPRKFCLGTPHTCWNAICRTWEYAPRSLRIVQDINHYSLPGTFPGTLKTKTPEKKPAD